MAGEAEVVEGTYAELIASESVTDTSFGTVSAALDTVLTDGSENYPLLDFKLDVTSGTPVENGEVRLFRVPHDGTDQAPTPNSTYVHHFVRSFKLDNAQDEYYLDGVPKIRSTEKFILQNVNGATITATLYVRGRTSRVAT